MDDVFADQVLSMINYQVSSSSAVKSSDFAIITSANSYVWAYNLGSRTSIIEIIALFAGIEGVLGRAIVSALVVVERQENITRAPLGKLILAVLEHAPEDRIEEGEV